MFQYKNLENLTKKISEQAEQEQNKVNKQHAKISTYLFKTKKTLGVCSPNFQQRSSFKYQKLIYSK
jgi:hypothetical protein